MADTNDSQNQFEAKPLRTYQSDVEGIMKEGGGSLSKIALAESEKRNRMGIPTEDSSAPDRSNLIITISASLIIISIGLFLGIYIYRSMSVAPIVPLLPRPILVSNSEKVLDISGLNRSQIINLLNRERNSTTLNLSTILAIKIKEGAGESAQIISSDKFLEKLQSHAPNEFVRSLEGTFLFGIYALSNNEPFLVLKTSYYQNAFAGMLAWEKDLRADLGPIFITAQPTAIPSSSDQIIGINTAFEDVVVKNRDARALRGPDGKIIFLYSFADKDTVVITTNANTLELVASKLLAGKIVQ